MDRLDCLSLTQEIIESREDKEFDEGIIVKGEPSVYTLDLDDDRFWPKGQERPDGLIVGQRSNGEWWVCFVELKHFALPKGFQVFLNQVRGISRESQKAGNEIEDSIRLLKWNMDELRRLNRGQIENLDDDRQDVIQQRDEHYNRLEQEITQIEESRSSLSIHVEDIDFDEASSKSLGAHKKSLISKARLQLLAGIWHFAHHRRCYNAENAPSRHGDHHHQLWARGQDLPTGMVNGDASCRNHRIAAVVVLMGQRSGSRSPDMLNAAIKNDVEFSGEPFCNTKPISFRILSTHLQPSSDNRLVRKFKNLDEFLQSARL
jgi:hypothetical protein